MWLFRYYIRFIFPIAVLASLNDGDNVLEERPFNDAMDNITKVNGILQDLIKNYKKFETLLKSDETFENDYSDIKETTQSLTTKTNRLGLATDVIYSEIEYSKPAEKITATPKKIAHLQLKSKDSESRDLSETTSSDDESSEEESNEIKARDDNETKIIRGPKIFTGDDIIINYGSPEMDTLIETKNNYKINRILNINNIRKDNTLTRKTGTNHVIEETTNYDNSDQELLSESKSDYESKFEFESDETDSEQNLNKNARMLLGQPNKLFNAESSDETSISSPELSKIELEVLSNNVPTLRDKYGMACIKLLIRKCFLALREAMKILKSRYSLRSSLRSNTLSNGKKGCIAEFEVSSKSPNKTFKKDLTEGNDFIDECIPNIARHFVPKREKVFVLNGDVKVKNVLRKSYDKACSEEFSNRCRTVCIASYQKACKKYNCRSSHKSYHSKNCRIQCKSQFRYDKRKRAKSGSGSSSSDSDNSSSD